MVVARIFWLYPSGYLALICLGKKIVFMGDDTWTQLYPSHFHESYPFPSMIVRDLDTVDTGVQTYLLPTIKGKWLTFSFAFHQLSNATSFLSHVPFTEIFVRQFLELGYHHSTFPWSRSRGSHLRVEPSSDEQENERVRRSDEEGHRKCWWRHFTPCDGRPRDDWRRKPWRMFLSTFSLEVKILHTYGLIRVHQKKKWKPPCSLTPSGTWHTCHKLYVEISPSLLFHLRSSKP